MRVVLPYTTKRKAVIDALDQSGFDYEMVDLSDGRFHYWHLISELWSAGETFATVEHDIVINQSTLRDFENCPCDWDIAPYPYAVMPDGHYAGLGCCKITDRLIARNPDAMRVDLNWPGWDKNHKPRHWCRVDGWLKQQLIENSERPHAHDLVQHLGDGWPSHGCVAKPKGMK